MFSRRRDSIDTQNIKKELTTTLKLIESKMTSVENTVNKVENKMVGVESKIAGVENILVSVESNVAVLDKNLSKELEEKIKLVHHDFHQRVSIIESDVPYIKQLSDNNIKSYNNLETEVNTIKQQIEQLRIEYEHEINELRKASVNSTITVDELQMYNYENTFDCEIDDSDVNYVVPESPKLRRWSLFD
jgi:archaellum component FlaC